MRVEVNKNELAGALSALGKLICRTSPVECWRSVRIEAQNHQVSFQTASPSETMQFTLSAETPEPFSVIVNFELFKTAVKSCRNQALALEYTDGRFEVDRCPLCVIQEAWPVLPEPGTDTCVTVIPENFVGMLAQAAPVVDRTSYRKILQGIHLCEDGIVATDGRELLHIPLALKLAAITIPFPLALLASKSTAGGQLSTYLHEEQRYFRFLLGPWTWTGKALPGPFPEWKQVVPKPETLPRKADLTPEAAAELMAFLKTVPDQPPHNPVILSCSKDGASLNVDACGTICTRIPATFSGEWNEFSVSLNKTLLQGLLQKGQIHFAFGDGMAPFAATGGIGNSVAMPLAFAHPKTVQPKQEESKMNEPANVVTAPVQPVAPTVNPEPVTVNPLDDLSSAVDEFKARLRAMFDDSSILARKVKEVALAQKQKERDFIQAKRAIERIRMAI